MHTCLLINNCPKPGDGVHSKLGGGDLSLLALLAGLPDKGWQAHVAVPGLGQLTDILLLRDIPFTVMPFERIGWDAPLRSLNATLSWRRFIKQIRPELIHANTTSVIRSFAWAAASLGIPYISHVRFIMDPGETRWTFRYFPKPRAFIFVSEALKREFWPEFSHYCPQSQCHVVHNAVDLARFHEEPLPKALPHRIGIVANLAPFKRHEDFLRMAAEMLKERQDLEFLIIGEDVLGKGRREILMSLATELGVERYFHFLGHRRDIPEILHSLHLLVLTSEDEPFGRVIIEGMASGRPVIATESGGIPEIIENGLTGRLVKVGDYQAISQAALALLSDRKAMEVMGQLAAAAVRSRFSLTSHAARISDIYNRIVS